jgi:hypothetical protein
MAIICALAGVANPEFVAATAPIFWGIYGLGMMLIYILYVIADEEKYFGKDGVVFFNNFASVLPYMGQPLSYIKYLDIGPAAVSLVDLVGFGTSAALSTILYWAPTPQSAQPA